MKKCPCKMLEASGKWNSLKKSGYPYNIDHALDRRKETGGISG